jgi:hypothetical protein
VIHQRLARMNLLNEERKKQSFRVRKKKDSKVVAPDN